MFGKPRKFQKDLIGLVWSFGLGAASRFVEPRSSLLEGFNFVSGKLLLRWAESRFAKPRNFPVRETDCHFLRRSKSNQKACSDVQKVAGGKFLCVGDRRNRENCERTWARRPCFKESTPSCDLDSNLRSIRDFGENDRRSSSNRLCRKTQPFRVSSVRIWIGAKGLPLCRRKTVVFRKRVIILQAHSSKRYSKRFAAR